MRTPSTQLPDSLGHGTFKPRVLPVVCSNVSPDFSGTFLAISPSATSGPAKVASNRSQAAACTRTQWGRVVFKDVNRNHLQAFGAVAETSYSFTPIRQRTYRPRSQSDFFRAREVSKGRMRKGNYSDEDDVVVIWDEWDVPGT
jgi:hypothetical protein